MEPDKPSRRYSNQIFLDDKDQTGTVLIAGQVCYLRLFCVLQISGSLLASMHYQVQREYNKTAKLPNATSEETLRISAAWDTLQSKVSSPVLSDVTSSFGSGRGLSQLA